MSDLIFTKSRIGSLAIKNRLIMSSVHLGYAENGFINDQIVRFYEQRAAGGIAAIIVGGVAVDQVGSLPNMISLADDTYIGGMRKLADAIHRNGCKVFVQLFHAGRNAYSSYTGQQTLAPSPVVSPFTREISKEMNISDISSIVNAFGEAAERAVKAGVDGVEISCSAGYLLSQFLSPLTNLRTDEYGGSEEGRAKFPHQVVKKVRTIVGRGVPVILRISGSSMIEGSYGISEMQRFCASFSNDEIDAIHVTGGWHEAPVPQISVHVPPGGHAFLAAAIKKSVSVPVIAANRINDGTIAEQILQNKFADFVAIGRGLVADPDLPNKIMSNGNIRKCQACNQGCIDHVFKQLPIRCMVNAQVGFEHEEIQKTLKPKKIMIIGGGVAGMEAARLAALANHQVLVFTNESSLGGQIQLASRPPHKQELANLGSYLANELSRLNVNIEYGIEVDKDFVAAIQPDYVILATGSKPIIPGIPGIKETHVLTAAEILATPEDSLPQICFGKVVIVGGGAVGLETAAYLGIQSLLPQEISVFIGKYLPQNKKDARAYEDISVIEMQEVIGKDIGKSTKWVLMKELTEMGVKMMTSTRIISIETGRVIVDRGGVTEEVPADTVILAIGSKPYDAELSAYLEAQHIPYSVIGDAQKPGRIMDAMAGALKAIAKL